MKLEDAITFDYVLLLPVKFLDTPDTVDTKSFITNNIKLNFP